jgi:NADPH:quinone reductase-like Zn-dependent oxidoreductase
MRAPLRDAAIGTLCTALAFGVAAAAAQAAQPATSAAPASPASAAAPAALPVPATMRAIVQTSGTDVAGLRLADVPTPRPAAGQVLLRVVAAGVNPVDWKRVAPKVDGAAGGIPGFDVAGVIAAVGPGVSGWSPGDAVFTRANGTYAQYVAAPATDVVRKPARFSFAQAAGIPVAGVAALQAAEAAQVARGDRVAVIGAAGGAGSVAVEIAKARGARVIASAHSSQREFLARLGVDEFVAYDRDDVAARIRSVDVVLNMVEGQATPALAYLKRGGRLASIAGDTDTARCTALGLTCHRIGPGYAGMSTGDALRALAGLADEGRYTVTVTRTFPLAEAAAAQRLNQTSDTTGKIVLVVDPALASRAH